MPRRPQAATPTAVAFANGDTVARVDIEVGVCGSVPALVKYQCGERVAPIA